MIQLEFIAKKVIFPQKFGIYYHSGPFVGSQSLLVSILCHYHCTHVRIRQYPLIMRTFLYTRGVDDDITIFFRHSFENLFFSHSLQPDIHFCLGKTCRVAVIQIDRTDLNESTFDRSSPLRMCKVQL